MKPRYDHTIRWLQYTSNCNFPLWKLKELRVKVVSILGEGGEGALSSERWGDPAILARVCQLRAAPWCATISWPACLLATHTRSSCTFSLTLSVKSSQVNWRQALRENYCACSWSLSSKNDKKWFPVPGFIGFVIWIAGFFIQDCVLFLSQRNLITRYPVIFNFRVGTGRVPGSRQTLVLSPFLAKLRSPPSLQPWSRGLGKMNWLH